MKKITFKDLTDDYKKKMKTSYDNRNKLGLSVEKLAIKIGEELNVSERTVRKWFKKINVNEKTDTADSEQYVIAKLKKHDNTKSRFLITWAQNNTPIHGKFFDNIKAYAGFIGADIHVVAGRYKNPTSVFQDNDQEFWCGDLIPYLDAGRHNIHKYMSILSDIKIQPTAVNPMSGLQGVSGINSCVFGAPKVQMEMIPVLEGEGNKPKMMLTTGAVTLMNYTDSKAGKNGEFHHTYGFVIVEIKDDETFYVRQVTADDKTGAFTDLCYRVDNSEINKVNSLAAAVLGDIHYGSHDQTLINLTHELLDKIVPDNVILHDVFDGLSINHHNIDDAYVQYGKEIHNTNSLQKEIDEMIDGLKLFEKYKKVVIVRSNHDDFLDRWLKNQDWKKQPTAKNHKLYMKYSAMLLEQFEKDMYNVKGVIPEIINTAFPNFITLRRNDSYRIKNWELSQHGDQGTNGSRGSLNQFRTLNTKIVVGHYHSPGRKDGALAVGTSTKLRLGYNFGASSWAQAHVLIHNDGRAQHITFVNDEKGNIGFTTFEI